MQELKTGFYFSENSIDIFNQTLDKDNLFPFLVKVNLPMETRGVLGNLFSQSGILDAFNAYAASLTVPSDSTPSTVEDFYGGVVNGDANQNFNLFSEAKMMTFKMHMESDPIAPDPEISNALSDTLISQDDGGQEFFEKLEQISQLETDEEIQQALDEEVETPFGAIIAQTLGISGEAIASQNQTESETFKVLIDQYKLLKKYKNDYGVDLYLDTLFSIGDESLKNVFEYANNKELNLSTELSSLLSKLKFINFAIYL